MVKVMENLSKMDDLGGGKAPIFGNTHIQRCFHVQSYPPFTLSLLSDRRWWWNDRRLVRKNLRPGELERDNDEDPLESGL